MSKTALETLRLIFNDQPDLLEIIKLGDIESEKLVNSFRENNELFAAPVNLYVTGRTGAGKTSLGNRLLAQSVMESMKSLLLYVKFCQKKKLVIFSKFFAMT